MPYAGRFHAFTVAFQALRQLDEKHHVHLVLRSRNLRNGRRCETSIFTPPFPWTTNMTLLAGCVKSLDLETETLQDWESNLLRGLMNGQLETLIIRGLHKPSSSGNGFLDHEPASTSNAVTLATDPRGLKSLTLRHCRLSHHENLEIFSYVFRKHGAALESFCMEHTGIFEQQWDLLLRLLGDLPSLTHVAFEDIFLMRDYRRDSGGGYHNEEEFVRAVQWKGRERLRRGCSAARQDTVGNGVRQPWRGHYRYYVFDFKRANEAAMGDS
jgi:hypothetical protein